MNELGIKTFNFDENMPEILRNKEEKISSFYRGDEKQIK